LYPAVLRILLPCTYSQIHSLIGGRGHIHNILSGMHMHDKTLLPLDSFDSHKTHKHLHTARIYPLATDTCRQTKYLVFLLAFDRSLFSPILRPSEVPAADVDGGVLGSPFRLTEGAASTVSCAQSLHGLFEIIFFVVDAVEAFDGPTVGAVVAERLDTVVADLVADIVLSELSRNRRCRYFKAS